MADAFGILRSYSFVVNVDADDRAWGMDAMASKSESTSREVRGPDGEDEDNHIGREINRSWFYDTVRDRQNRLWADTRVKKGVDLARKSQHQVSCDDKFNEGGYLRAEGVHDGRLLLAHGDCTIWVGVKNVSLSELSRWRRRFARYSIVPLTDYPRKLFSRIVDPNKLCSHRGSYDYSVTICQETLILSFPCRVQGIIA